ncbi:MAG: sigma-54-dependent Fis family transcriptional regulator [Spirochaetales bacterium]|nr:sigma-54-dependent Fis family transcriptional regulator [Spirochaetales bacterium]
MPSILIIDDEQGIRTVLKDVLEDEGYDVVLAEDGYQGLSKLQAHPVDLVILDVWLPNMGGIDVLKKLKEDYADIEVIIISGHANIDIAVKAVKMGAFDFLEKPLSLERVITVVRNALALEGLRKENRTLKNSIFMEDQMIGSSTAMKKIRALIQQSADSDARILILGENGTGKELVARAIHMKSKRAFGPFIEVNCAAIPDTLIESELFGHEKGAFTNAYSRRKGKFELAHRGSLFLDEVADLSLNAQAKVLRVIQELIFERIGGEEQISVDVRLIAATNKNIEEQIKKGKFREDLYFRLNVVPIFVPPLRERLEDIEELITYFMKKYKHPKYPQPKKISSDAMTILKSYHWPGNIRELKNFMERINIMTEEQVILPATVNQYLGAIETEAPDTMLHAFSDMKLNQAKDQFEKEFIVHKLKDNSFNISKTAEILGLYPSNLHNKIKKLGIKIERCS